MFLLSRTFLNIIIFIYFHDHCVLSPYDSIDHTTLPTRNAVVLCAVCILPYSKLLGFYLYED